MIVVQDQQTKILHGFNTFIQSHRFTDLLLINL